MFANKTLRLLILTAAATCFLGAAPHDGQHDFDFNIGTWRTQIKRVLNPFASETGTVEMTGTVSVRKVWDGRGQLEEIDADGPDGHWQGLTMFLYNPGSHQWSQSFINSKMAVLEKPLTGSFSNGRGELYSSDTFDGRAILVRGVWSDISPDAHQYQESYSNDGGVSWHTAFTGKLTRLKAQAAAPPDPDQADSQQHEFDFDFGAWKTHSKRLLHPLTRSEAWVEMDGSTVVEKVWGGRANLAEYKADGSAGHVELLSLRWYSPAARQWNIDFATPAAGMLGVPGVGEFKGGRGDFYDQETINGRAILVRFSIWRISADRARSEQAFSDDGGKTWEVNWINEYTRAKPQS